MSAVMPPLLTSYRALTGALAPIAGLWLGARGQKEDTSRRGERFGRDARARPPGELIWLHAASVGESGVALQLIAELKPRRPNARFLITTGTRTSADLIAQRAPDILHAYVPLDTPSAARAFIAHWRPDLGVFIESEIWPNLILEARKAGARLALVNARLSPKSLASWLKNKASGAHLFRQFDVIACADARTAEALSALRGERLPQLANLKLSAPAPALDAQKLAALKAETGARPAWIAASTHEGEDEIALAAHALLRQEKPDALLLLAPRHPERGERIAALAGNTPRRALEQTIGDSPVYVADTMGELGLIYAAAPVALICGSLLPELKGHNPIEAVRLGAAALTGPYVESFADIFAALENAGGAAIVRDAEAIAREVASLWADETERARRLQAAQSALTGGETALQTTLDQLAALLSPANPSNQSAHAPA